MVQLAAFLHWFETMMVSLLTHICVDGPQCDILILEKLLT